MFAARSRLGPGSPLARRAIGRDSSRWTPIAAFKASLTCVRCCGCSQPWSSWALLSAARQALPAGIGLTGQYYANAKWDGQPVMTVVDREPSTAQLLERWNNEPPQTFSAAWNGYLSIVRPGLYFFATTSHDRSRLYIDNKIVVDNTGGHELDRREAFGWTAGRTASSSNTSMSAASPADPAEMGVGVRRRQRQDLPGRAALGAVATAVRPRDGRRRSDRRGASDGVAKILIVLAAVWCRARLADLPARRLDPLAGGVPPQSDGVLLCC